MFFLGGGGGGAVVVVVGLPVAQPNMLRWQVTASEKDKMADV